MKIEQLPPHENLTPEEALVYCARNHEEFAEGVIVCGYNADGELMVRSSHMTRAEATFLTLNLLDHCRGVSDE